MQILFRPCLHRSDSKTKKKSVETIAYYHFEALDSPLLNNKTMIPRLMFKYIIHPLRIDLCKHRRRNHFLLLS